MLSIIGWRMAECERLGVRFHFNTYAEPDTVTGTRPDVLIIATGGLPHTVPLSEGTDLAVTAWDILSGDVSPDREVLIFDNAGDTVGLQAAEVIAATGARVEIVSPDRGLSHEVMPMTLTPFLRALQDRDVTFTVTRRLTAIRRQGNTLEAALGSDWSGATGLRAVDQVVINNGTLPLDGLYTAFRPRSSNLGAVDQKALLALAPQATAANPDGQFQLFRIGDAVASRNTHAAIFDALRLTRAI